MSNYIKFGLKAAFTIFCLYLISEKIDTDELIRQTKEISLITIIAGLVIFLTHLLAVAIRWQYYVKAMASEIDLWSATKLVAIGSFFNQVFFGTIAGDATRIIYLRGKEATLTCAVGSVLLDRYTAMLTMWACVVIAVPFIDASFTGDSVAAGGVLGICFGGLLLLGLPIVSFFEFIFRWQWLNFLRPSFQFVLAMSKAFNAAFFNLKDFLAVYIPSAYVIITSSIVIWLVGIDLNANLPIGLTLLVTPVALLISAIPITIGGWGLRELSFVTLLSLMDIPLETSFIISLSFGLLVLASSLIGGVLWLFEKSPTPNTKETAAYK